MRDKKLSKSAADMLTESEERASQKSAGKMPDITHDFHTIKSIYFDNAATTQTPRPVLQAMDAYYSEYRANVHRGMCALSERATDEYERARKDTSDFIRSKTNEVIFTSGTTASLNMAAGMLASRCKNKRIVVSRLEHHSNLLPWRRIAGNHTDVIPVKDNAELDMACAEKMITKDTAIVAVTHASNVLGNVVDVRRIADMAHDVGAIVVIDAAQSAPHMLVDVKKMGADMIAFSGHKMMGPTGTGVLYCREELLSTLEPVTLGGGVVSSLDENGNASWVEIPQRFEGGTPNIAGAIGLGAAARYLVKNGKAIQSSDAVLAKRFLESAKEFNDAHDGVMKLHGHDRTAGENGLPIFSFNIGKLHPHDVGYLLGTDGICVRAGNHCAQPLMKMLGINGSVRASLYAYNTPLEIEKFFESLERVMKKLS